MDCNSTILDLILRHPRLCKNVLIKACEFQTPNVYTYGLLGDMDEQACGVG